MEHGLPKELRQYCRQKQERRIYTKCNFTGGEENVFQRRLKTTQY